MSDFAPGDAVVCVDDSPCKCCGDPVPVNRGRTYRVTSLSSGYNDRVGQRILTLHLAGVAITGGRHVGWGVNCERFRKIDPASESFTEQVRACRPIRKDVSA